MCGNAPLAASMMPEPEETSLLDDLNLQPLQALHVRQPRPVHPPPGAARLLQPVRESVPGRLRVLVLPADLRHNLQSQPPEPPEPRRRPPPPAAERRPLLQRGRPGQVFRHNLQPHVPHRQALPGPLRLDHRRRRVEPRREPVEEDELVVFKGQGPCLKVHLAAGPEKARRHPRQRPLRAEHPSRRLVQLPDPLPCPLLDQILRALLCLHLLPLVPAFAALVPLRKLLYRLLVLNLHLNLLFEIRIQRMEDVAAQHGDRIAHRQLLGLDRAHHVGPVEDPQPHFHRQRQQTRRRLGAVGPAVTGTASLSSWGNTIPVCWSTIAGVVLVGSMSEALVIADRRRVPKHEWTVLIFRPRHD
ncbi:hypothetical protein Trco_002309 [Trichoderma cornu-damae]|uniref:Uncharacterized protein n=1 Tax=Trichoderma cornu-damae TaxID=654480 RepID=A0A9P8TXW7_9HYPO|nr:hypothetical protein Trco_002309 [Trichoderma cornu-damae]